MSKISPRLPWPAPEFSATNTSIYYSYFDSHSKIPVDTTVSRIHSAAGCCPRSKRHTHLIRRSKQPPSEEPCKVPHRLKITRARPRPPSELIDLSSSRVYLSQQSFGFLLQRNARPNDQRVCVCRDKQMQTAVPTLLAAVWSNNCLQYSSATTRSPFDLACLAKNKNASATSLRASGCEFSVSELSATAPSQACAS